MPPSFDVKNKFYDDAGQDVHLMDCLRGVCYSAIRLPGNRKSLGNRISHRELRFFDTF